MAVALGLSRSATTAVLARLEKKELVQRSPSPTDARSHLVTLTPTAATRLDRLWRPMMKAGSDHLNGYTSEELDLLILFMKRSEALLASAMPDVSP